MHPTMPADSASPARRYPVLYELDARTFVRGLGPTATLDDIDDVVLDRVLPPATDWLYLLGVWQTGVAGRTVSRDDPLIRADCERTLVDLTDDDICGSCFSVTGYRVAGMLGGDDALDRLRALLAGRGVRLMLDFVPNHTAPDHPWVRSHPDRYIEGTEADLSAAPDRWERVEIDDTTRVFAMGRDPFFAGWSDTLQLDYSSVELRDAMTSEMLTAAALCDGLRCDMAMLLLPDVFERTWGRMIEPFWPDALAEVRRTRPDFMFMAEVYWDREFDLQQQGFDATYDKRLYDRLIGDLEKVRGHLRGDPDYQARSARFLENHDESRAAEAFGTGDRHRAAVTYLSEGLRFFHHGQSDGARIHVPVHLCRAPREAAVADLAAFYRDLFELLDDPIVHVGDWKLLESRSAWDGNMTGDDIVAFSWSRPDDASVCLLACINLADHRSQAYVRLPSDGLAGRTFLLRDRLGPEQHRRGGDDLDVEPWAHHVFAIEPAD
jgi:hypothetical protein